MRRRDPGTRAHVDVHDIRSFHAMQLEREL
jgi:hypothetical protein